MPSVWFTRVPSGSVVDEALVARPLRQVRDAVHRPVERHLSPFASRRARGAGTRSRRCGLVSSPQRRGALGAERALVDRAARVALHVDGPAVLGIDQLRAAHGAVGADGGADLVRLLQARPEAPRRLALRRASLAGLPRDLARHGPVAQEAAGAARLGSGGGGASSSCVPFFGPCPRLRSPIPR